MQVHNYVYQINKMLSFVIHAGYQGTDFSENIFCDVATFIFRTNHHQRQHFYWLITIALLIIKTNTVHKNVGLDVDVDMYIHVHVYK